MHPHFNAFISLNVKMRLAIPFIKTRFRHHILGHITCEILIFKAAFIACRINTAACVTMVVTVATQIVWELELQSGHC